MKSTKNVFVQLLVDEPMRENEQYIRRMDEKLAMSHPTVKEKLKELREAKIALREERFMRSRIFVDLANITYWELHRLKSGTPSKELIAKLRMVVDYHESNPEPSRFTESAETVSVQGGSEEQKSGESTLVES